MLSYLLSLAASAEVANMVLNTHFLGLLLRLIKGQSEGRGGSSSSTTRRQSSPDGRSSALSTRALAATVLATMLRYATYVQAPSQRYLRTSAPPHLHTCTHAHMHTYMHTLSLTER